MAIIVYEKYKNVCAQLMWIILIIRNVTKTHLPNKLFDSQQQQKKNLMRLCLGKVHN